MKKIIEIIKNNIPSIVISIVIGCTFQVTANNNITSKLVSYSNDKTNENTVNGALNELFSAVDINEEIVDIKSKIENLEDTTAVTNLVNTLYPVGSIYITTSGANPSTYFSGTTWERYGVGKTLLSTDGTSGQTGGSTTATLAIANLPSHNHSIPALTGSAASSGAHTHTLTAKGTVSSTFTGSKTTTVSNGAHTHKGYFSGAGTTINSGIPVLIDSGSDTVIDSTGTAITNSAGAHTHDVTAKGTVSSTFTGSSATSSEAGAHAHDVTTTASTSGKTGSGTAFSVQDPYITVYMWKRTA